MGADGLSKYGVGEKIRTLLRNRWRRGERRVEGV